MTPQAASSAKRLADLGHPDAAPMGDQRPGWIDAFRRVRAETEGRAAPLSPEDQVVQSMPDASPTKWHRAHTTWFFEQFLLKAHLTDYREFDAQFGYLFNSYYVAVGERHARPQRGLVTRPDSEHVGRYRAHVEDAIGRLIETADQSKLPEILRILEIGMHHEQQHQELLLTDILHAFAQNPVSPTYNAAWWMPPATGRAGYVEIPSGIHVVGFEGEGFSFDNESPAHRVFQQPVKIARGLVTNAEWLAFIADGGYRTPSLWLSDGWTMVETQGWDSPGYWREIDGVWHMMTLGGQRPVDPAVPVCHVSYYEADAFARWSGKDLPSEAEWEIAARQNLIDDALGIVWQWTRSAYLAYPGYRAADGALGEYNGKFMINQMVLRGSSLATPNGHARASYRNFFPPPARWQFSGLRLVDHAG